MTVFFCTQRMSSASTPPVLCVRLCWHHWTDSNVYWSHRESSLNHLPNIWLLSSVSAQASQSHETVIKHAIDILTMCQLNALSPFHLMTSWNLCGTLHELSGKYSVSACLSSTLSFGENRLLGLFRFAKLMLNCSLLCWASTWWDRKAVPSCSNQLSLAL